MAKTLTGRFCVRLSALQPSQLYISAAKLAALTRRGAGRGKGRAAPLPVKRLGGRIVLTDGHTRALAAHLAGETHVWACWDEDDLDWEAYEICVRWCRDEGIRRIADLARRVIDATAYERLWHDRCKRMHRQLAASRRRQSAKSAPSVVSWK